MSAASAAREAKKKAGEIGAYQLNTTTVYKGTLVNVRAADGYAYPARSGTATDRFIGVAFETKTSPTAGDLIRVEKEGSFVFAHSGLAQTDVGSAAYASDDSTVTTTSTNNQLVGYIQEIIDSSNVRVRINRGVQ